MCDKKYQLVSLKKMGDSRGEMCVIEGQKQVPFAIARIFYDYHNAPGDVESRGNHANRNSQFAFVCVAGSCVVSVDDGVNQDTYTLSDPTQMLVVDKMVWKEMSGFSPDSVLLVLSSHVYDQNEYIRDYAEFRAAVNAAEEER